jgi:hypothetical protein
MNGWMDGQTGEQTAIQRSGQRFLVTIMSSILGLRLAQVSTPRM